MLQTPQQVRRLRNDRWLRARKAEQHYHGRLRSVARQIGALIRGHAPEGTPESAGPLMRALNAYAELIEPWARRVAGFMLEDVDARNKRAWNETGHEIGRELRKEVASTPTGGLFRGLLEEQVGLIQSIPLKAAEQVHEKVQEGMFKGTRSTTIAKELMEIPGMTERRAKLIARTEVSRAAVTLTQARAQAIGSEGYIWRTAQDADVRPEHKRLNGTFVRWDRPPRTEPGLSAYHAGAGPNCRCYPEPVLPEF